MSYSPDGRNKISKSLNTVMLVMSFSFLGFLDIVGGIVGGSYVGHGQTVNSARETVHNIKVGCIQKYSG